MARNLGSGHHENEWGDALLQACAGLTVKVPPNLPEYSYQLYATLGVTPEVDDSLPPWKPPLRGREQWSSPS